MGERLVFPEAGLSFEVVGLTHTLQLAYISKRARRKGGLDKGLAMMRALEVGIVDPPMTEQTIIDLVREHPDVAAHLAIRIAELTTG